MRRAEVWWADLPPPYGPRPVVILTRDAVAGSIGSVVACILTRTVRGLPTEVEFGRREGLLVPCVANLDNILTIPRPRFLRLLGSCSREKTAELNAALSLALGLR